MTLERPAIGAGSIRGGSIRAASTGAEPVDADLVTSDLVDGTAFEAQFPGLYRDAYRVAYRLLGNRSEAQDVAQEACARAFSRWSSVRDHAAPWCVRVASNLALDVQRARVRAVRREGRIRVAGRAAGADAAVGSVSDDRMDLVRALQLLPRRQRETVVLRYLGDLSEVQTAEALDLTVGSVKTHASRGLIRLREVLAR